MRAIQLISDIVPALRTSDSGIRALNWMEIFRISHLPIVNNSEFLGLISDSDIYDYDMAEEPIGNHKLSLIRPFVKAEQHIFEVMELASNLKLSIIPVLNDKKEYLGLITIMDLVHYFAELAAFKNPGGVIVLEMHATDYSLAQIAQIIEGNDARILSLYLSQPDDSMKILVTLKVNKTDLSGILQTFNRYEYEVKDSFMEDNEIDTLYNSRYEEFMKYLSI